MHQQRKPPVVEAWSDDKLTSTHNWANSNMLVPMNILHLTYSTGMVFKASLRRDSFRFRRTGGIMPNRDYGVILCDRLVAPFPPKFQ
jgi:hypothetical protein